MFSIPEYTIPKLVKIKRIYTGIALAWMILLPIYFFYKLYSTHHFLKEKYIEWYDTRWTSFNIYDLYQQAAPRFSLSWYIAIWMILTIAIIWSFIKNWNRKQFMMLLMFIGVYSAHVYVDIAMRINILPETITFFYHCYF